MNTNAAGIKINVSGIVQGVGFRPFVYATATRLHLTGSVWNTSKGVEIEIFGNLHDLDQFLIDLKEKHPVLARIDQIESSAIPFQILTDFSIKSSQAEEGQFLPVSPDMSICPDCLKELFDPKNRRYRYPFINCTNCGPRFSIIKNIPYDRPLTTMADFKLCPACQAEYDNPLDRRFHAQPVACAECGPRLQFINQGQIIGKYEGALTTARKFIEDGKIVAIKGLGGYHLACNASNEEAVQSLRSRKKRSDRPFALMSYNLETIKKFCHITDEEAAILQSPQHPIALLTKREDCSLPEALAPNQNHLGFMIPYTPLHYLLLELDEGFPEVLVMTSGNMSDEPIAYEDEDARVRMAEIADGFLVHNRPIQMRVDDSVVRVVEQQPYFLRRSRGYAPDPIILNDEIPQMLACGAELKNTFCLSRSHYAFLSHHIGDLENYETLSSFENGILHFQNLFRIKPLKIVVDLHPEYLSTKYAVDRACKEQLPLLQVQHHHAHLAACLADNHWVSGQDVIGLIFDGTGYGTDGKIWGGEVLVGEYSSVKRRFHLAETMLPGGDSAIRNPSKIALSNLYSADLPWTEDLPPVQALSEQELAILKTQLENRLNCPITTSMGRLFDAVASLVGIRQIATYEGQAAIELENVCDPQEENAYKFTLNTDNIETAEVFDHILLNLRMGISKSTISARFHNGLANLCLDICKTIQKESGLQTVALSGGVWQNITLLTKTTTLLRNQGFSVLQHHQVPANDGGIALGQLMVAAAAKESN
ncbi:MAG: carbamoyltransferase HypF [Chloroflexi bacterium HGW-Chloroflexi-4]|nr:MAG: carbamoyltransferase HypF [Chloroflexi bacterium HGW-Chloroflexi-4]